MRVALIGIWTFYKKARPTHGPYDIFYVSFIFFFGIVLILLINNLLKKTPSAQNKTGAIFYPPKNTISYSKDYPLSAPTIYKIESNNSPQKQFMKWAPLSKAQYTEISIFLSNYLLSSQGDRVAMAHSVEGRFPFLDYRVVEFACSLPPRYRLNVLKDKYILRKTAQKVIPPELANRPKQPYRAPISRCFFGNHRLDYVNELLSADALQQAGYFNPGKVTKLIEKCRKQEGYLLSERENMALVGIISTQLLDHLFIQTFPSFPIAEPEEKK